MTHFLLAPEGTLSVSVNSSSYWQDITFPRHILSSAYLTKLLYSLQTGPLSRMSLKLGDLSLFSVPTDIYICNTYSEWYGSQHAYYDGVVVVLPSLPLS